VVQGVATAANRTTTGGTLQTSLLSLGEARQHVIEQVGKLVEAQTGHFQKYSRIAAQIVEATDHRQPQALQEYTSAPLVYLNEQLL
jgi:hypothetical protein